MTQNDGTYTLPAGLLTGKGYTHIRMVSPRHLTGYYYAEIICNQRLKGTSPMILRYHQSSYEKPAVRNYANLQVTDHLNETVVYNGESSAYTNLTRVKKTSQITKSTTNTVVDLDTNTVTAAFTIKGYEYLNVTSVPDKYAEGFSHEEAVFYDLLPPGYVYLSSKGVTTGGAAAVTTNPSMTGATLVSAPVTIDDYKGTGRQLVIFKVKSLKATDRNLAQYSSNLYTGFAVKFYAITTFEDVTTYGATSYNNAAYMRADRKEFNISYTEGSFDAPSPYYARTEAGEFALRDVDGDGNTGTKDMMFTYATVNPDLVVAAETGIKKSVKGNSGYYRSADTITTGKEYTYRLVLETAEYGTTSNIYIADILEGVVDEDWNGTLKSVDLSMLRRLGISPKLYYSTNPGLHYSTVSTEDKGKAFKPGTAEYAAAGWTSAKPEDMSKVTAILIDCSTALDGTPIAFTERKQLVVTLTMAAPEDLPEHTITYNEAAYWVDLQAIGSDIVTPSFTIGNRVQLEIKQYQDLVFTKLVDTEGDETATKPLGGAEFRLYQCTKAEEEGHTHTQQSSFSTSGSCYNTLVGTAYSFADGTVQFTTLDTGSYALVEWSARNGVGAYAQYDYWTFEVDASKGTITVPQGNPNISLAFEQDGDGNLSLTNHMRKIALTVNKTWTDGNDSWLRKDLIIDLYRNDVLFDSREMPLGTTSVAFENLYVADDYGEIYTYRVCEREVPDGYSASKSSDFTLRYIQANKAATSSITNTRLGVLDIRKTVVGAQTDEDFILTLSLKKGSSATASATGAGTYPLRRYANAEALAADIYTEETITVDENGLASFSIRDGQILRVYNLPTSSVYATLTEETQQYQVSYTGCSNQKLSYRTVYMTVKNTVMPVDVEIPVEKVITGQSRPTEKKFTFTLNGEGISLKTVLTGEGTGSFDQLTFTKAGTYTYTVAETADKEQGYTYDAKTRQLAIVVTNDHGQLKASLTVDGNATDKVSFTNHYEPLPVSVTLPVEKIITGQPRPAEKDFTFVLAGEGIKQEVTITGEGSTHFEPLTFTKAGSYTYTVTETDSGETGYTYDSAAHTVAVTVTDENGQLKAAWTLDGMAADKVSFTNHYEPLPASVTLPVEKIITGQSRPEGLEQTFTFTLTGDSLQAPLTAQITDEGKAQFAPISFTQAGTYQFEIQEEAGKAEGYSYDGTTIQVIVTVLDLDGALQTWWRCEGTSGILFTNTYTPAPAEATLQVEKRIEGSQRPTGEEQTFTFTLAADDAAFPVPENLCVTISDEGSTSFAPISFTAAGEYTYTLTESAEGAPGYTYDAVPKAITVSVTDIGGKLEATVQTENDGNTTVFVNHYDVTSVSVALPVRKIVSNQQPPKGQEETFLFRLETLEDAPMPEGDTLTITGSGSAAFAPIEFKQAGSYVYRISEIPGNHTGYTYDGTVHTITVTVTDTESVLGAVWTVDGDAGQTAAVFENSYTPTPVSLRIPVQKVVTGETPTQEQTFVFALTAAAGKPLTTEITGSGDAFFPGITYTSAGTWRYTLSEIAGSANGYTYDSHVYELTVTVTDQEGKLSVSYTCDGLKNATPVFTNQYQTPHTPVPPIIIEELQTALGSGLVMNEGYCLD